MMTISEADIKRQVRGFYDQIGWQQISEGMYQNARYEDLRPVAREYVHRSHLRVNRYLKPRGHLLLDAGSGPIQYPEYLTYSEGYDYRVCLDISIQALCEARHRIGAYGLFVVADIANLPFKADVFDGIVSLHAIQHLPADEHRQTYAELYRVLKPASIAVVVNGWMQSRLTGWLENIIVFFNRRRRGQMAKETGEEFGKGTFVRKTNARRLRAQLAGAVPIEIYVWRSLSVRFLRLFVRPRLGGKAFLRLVYWLEERFPRFLGENGQYPLIVVHKT